MSTTKRVTGDYNIVSVDTSADNVNITTNCVNIDGNLTVEGNLTYINVTELNVFDPFIVVNASNTATYSANSGILTHITSNTYAGIRYNDDSGSWELSTSTSSSGETGSWSPILSSGSIAAGANTDVQFNNNGALGGNSNFTFNYATSALSLNGDFVLVNQGSAPSPVANSKVIYANTAGSGGSGVYFVDGSTSDELISKSKAIVFSIIF